MPHYRTRTSAKVVCAAGTAKHVLSVITGATRRVGLKRLILTGHSVTSTDLPMRVQIIQWDTDGTGTAVTPSTQEPAETAAISTSKEAYTVAATTNAVTRADFSVPPSAMADLVLTDPQTGEPIMCPVSKTTMVVVTADAGAGQSVMAELWFDE